MFITNVFNFASEGKCYRYGSINMPIDMWGPWHTADDKSEGTLISVQKSVVDMITPEKVMDIFQFFTMFATDKKYRKYKIICRYQQYEGANLIVERVKAGYPKKGLIWHFQGSGKSLLMVFAAYKLRMIPELKNPTVVIVDDIQDALFRTNALTKDNWRRQQKEASEKYVASLFARIIPSADIHRDNYYPVKASTKQMNENDIIITYDADYIGEKRKTQLAKKRWAGRKIYPNDPCPCGSGKKYKKCCGKNNK